MTWTLWYLLLNEVIDLVMFIGGVCSIASDAFSDSPGPVGLDIVAEIFTAVYLVINSVLLHKVKNEKHEFGYRSLNEEKRAPTSLFHSGSSSLRSGPSLGRPNSPEYADVPFSDPPARGDKCLFFFFHGVTSLLMTVIAYACFFTCGVEKDNSGYTYILVMLFYEPLKFFHSLILIFRIL